MPTYFINKLLLQVNNDVLNQSTIIVYRVSTIESKATKYELPASATTFNRKLSDIDDEMCWLAISYISIKHADEVNRYWVNLYIITSIYNQQFVMKQTYELRLLVGSAEL